MLIVCGPHLTRARRSGLRSGALALCVIAACFAGAIGGCSSSPPDTATSLQASDFAGEPGAAASENQTTEQSVAVTTRSSPSPRPAYSVTRTGPVAASESMFDVTAAVGKPDLSGPAGAAVGKPVLINAKVGDINGLPIYATDFLKPLEARLIAEADRLPRAEWTQSAQKAIAEKLQQSITDELLQAEARAQLTPEQKQGLFALVQSIQNDLIAKNYGSRVLTEQRLSPEGQTVESFTKDKEESELIRFQIRQQVMSRVHVPWRDINLQYNKDYDKFNPNPTAVLRLIRLAKSEAAEVDEVKRALDAGDDFSTVASRPSNEWEPAKAGLYTKEFEGDYDKATLFNIPELNAAACKLEPGQWAGPIDIGTRVAFVHLDGVTRSQTDLYAAQLNIEASLRDRRWREELDKYVGMLLERASVSNQAEMGQRLLEIATQRYYPPGKREPSAPMAQPRTR